MAGFTWKSSIPSNDVTSRGHIGVFVTSPITHTRDSIGSLEPQKQKSLLFQFFYKLLGKSLVKKLILLRLRRDPSAGTSYVLRTSEDTPRLVLGVGRDLRLKNNFIKGFVGRGTGRGLWDARASHYKTYILYIAENNLKASRYTYIRNDR